MNHIQILEVEEVQKRIKEILLTKHANANELKNDIFNVFLDWANGEKLVIEKSRDMGIEFKEKSDQLEAFILLTKSVLEYEVVPNQ